MQRKRPLTHPEEGDEANQRAVRRVAAAHAMIASLPVSADTKVLCACVVI